MEIILVLDYVEEKNSTKVVKIIQNYVGVVSKMVWRKQICASAITATENCVIHGKSLQFIKWEIGKALKQVNLVATDVISAAY